ncbi:MAG: CsbD family protein [Bacteroidota bacterium]
MDHTKDRLEDRLDHEQAEGRKDQAAGALGEMKGKVKKNVGDLVGNESMEAEGRMEEAQGKVQREAGNLRSEAADRAEDMID